MPGKILVATDGSAHAARAVAAVARLPWPDGSEVRLISVLDPLRNMPQTAASNRARAEAALAEARARIEKAGHRCTAEVVTGTTSQAILDAAAAWGATVIVLGARGLGLVRTMFVGSVSAAVARAAPSSALVVKKDLATPLRAVMAIDGSEEAHTAARRLAELRAPGNVVTVMQCLEQPEVTSLRLLPRGTAQAIRGELARATEELRRAAEAEVAKVVELFRKAGWKAQGMVRAGGEARGVVRVVSPPSEILALARKVSASLVAVGPRGATGLERILLGSVSEALLASPGITLFIGR